MGLRQLATVALISSTAYGEISVGEWPGFRGDGKSRGTGNNVALEWTNESGVLWRKKLQGFGQSSPVFWGDTVYVTSVGGKNKEHLYVEAFDRLSGNRRWLHQAKASETVETVSRMISQGAPTPVAGPLGLHAFFESGDLVSLDHRGNLRWSRKLTKEFGKFKGGHGLGSSLVGAANKLLLLIDHDGPSYLLCMAREDGKTSWKIDREPRVSWTSPLYQEHADGARVLVSSNGRFDAYRFKDGKALWWADGIKKNTVASPACNGDLVVFGSSSPRQTKAFRLGGSGDVAKTHLAWIAESATTSFPSPVIHNEVVYLINRAGSLQAHRMENGSQLWKTRLPGEAWATPIIASGRLYVFCKNGKTAIFDATGASPTPLSVNTLSIEDDDLVYGVGLAKGSFVFRTGRELIAIAARKDDRGQ